MTGVYSSNDVIIREKANVKFMISMWNGQQTLEIKLSQDNPKIYQSRPPIDLKQVIDNYSVSPSKPIENLLRAINSVSFQKVH